MSYKYANYSKFGNNVQTPSSDPLTFCLVDTMDRKFQHGGTAADYGPRSQKCQAFMAQRCADKWDGFCEYFYVENGSGGSWPNQQAWPNMAQPITDTTKYTGQLSTGSQLLGDAASRRFCTYANCAPTCESFDPMNPNSPKVYYYNNCNSKDCSSDCIPICTVDTTTIDQDPLMDRCLQNPTAAAPTLMNICNTAKREGLDLSGTKIGAFCQKYDQGLQQLKR